MKPQDRTRAIFTSKVEPTMRLLLAVLADFMNEQDVCWPGAETVAERTGLCERQTRDLLNDAEVRGLIRRTARDHKVRDITIEWEVLAAAPAPATKRGGARTPAKTAPVGAKTAPHTGVQTLPVGVQSLPVWGAKTAAQGSKDCTRSVQEASSEASSEASTRALDPTKPSDDPPAAAMNTPKRIDLTLDDPNRIVPPPPLEVLPPRQTSGPPLFAAPVKAPAPDPVAETHAVYRQAHKRSTLTDDNRKAVRTLIQRCEGPERAQSYLAWVANSMDERAMQLRGDAPWPDGKPHARDDLYSLAQPHFVAKAMAAVDAWVARGRIDLYVPAAAERPMRTSRSMDVARALYEEGLEHTEHHALAPRRETR